MTASRLVDDFFRHEYGRLVAMLVHRFGVAQIDIVEDAVQSALMSALQSWTRTGLPDNPSAWLFRVADNSVRGELRQGARRDAILQRHGDAGLRVEPAPTAPSFAGDVDDDLLRMLFVCCDATLAVESQLVLALKTLCGFSVREIAHRLFATEANVYKRLQRARARLQQAPAGLTEITAEHVRARLHGVHAVVYLMFTEGHLSSHAELPIRKELCEEAVRLATLVAQHPAGGDPSTCALVALMHLHAARLEARQDASGGLVLLQEQDRSRWDRARIHLGLSWLARSARGDAYSRFHAEAAIAAEHCLAPTFEQTRWDPIVEAYRRLEQLDPSPLHRLNRAIAVAQLDGPRAGLAVLDGAEPPTWLSGSYLWSATQADLHRRCGDSAKAKHHRDVAIASAPTDAMRQLLRRRLGPTAD